MHKSFSFRALRDSFKTEEKILKENIKELIKTNKIDEIDPVHGTALNKAIKLEDKKIIAELLKNNVNTIIPLLFLIENHKDITEIKQFIDFFSSEKLLHLSIKHLILQNRNIKDIKKLIDLSLHLSPHKKLIDFTALLAIKNNKSLEYIRELIDSSEVSHDALYEAVYQGRSDLVKYFIEEKGFDANTTIDNPVHGGAILSIAIMRDHTDVMDYLLTKGAIPSQGVISATIKGNAKILEKLFEYGATASGNYSEDPVALVVCGAIAAYEPNYKALGSKTEQDLLKYVETLKCLLEHNGNPNALILERGAVVLIALSELIDKPKNLIYKDICKLLIKHEADISKFKHDKDKEYIAIIEQLKAEIIQETPINNVNDFDEGYVSDANTETTTGSRLEEAAKSQFFSLGEIEALGKNPTNLGGDIKDIFDSEFES